MSCGIRSLDDLMGRCRIDEITGCWHWGMGTDGDGRPSLWLPGLRRHVSLGAAIGYLRTGRGPTKGINWYCTCETTNCANPEHRKAGNRSSQMRAAGLTKCSVVRAHIAAGKRATSKLTDEAVQAIRSSDDLLRIVAERHGISMSHASRIRRGEMRLALGVRGASVFNLGCVA